MIEWIKNNFGGFFKSVGKLFNLDRPVFYGGIIVLGAIVLLLAIIVIIICVAVSKKRKNKKLAKEKQDALEIKAEPITEQPVEQSVVQEDEVKEEPIVEQPVEQAPVAQEQTAVAEEAPVAQEKPIEEKPVAEDKPAVKPATKPRTTAKPKKDEKVEKPVAKPAKKMNGKWVVEKLSEGEFASHLLASNGEVMLTSEIYTTEEGARNGIATIIRGVESGNFLIYQDKNKNYYYKIKTANNRLLCVGEIYKSKDGCLKAVESVKRIAKDSPIAPEIKIGSGYAEYSPLDLSGVEVKKGMTGKWRIVKTESGNFSAQLFASNGQLMLATEEVALEKSAKNAIESVKKNSLQGNFIIDRDKFGRFYYKLRNAQKSVICIGETYDKLESCVSAIESVRRFAMTAILVAE